MRNKTLIAMIERVKTKQCSIRGVVYVYVNYSNNNEFGKSYVGCTTEENIRKKQWDSENEHYAGKKIDEARKSYKDSFVYRVEEVFWGDDKSEMEKYLEKREAFYIQVYDSYNNGYNSNMGGRGNLGVKMSNETKQKMRERKLGTKRSDETKTKISVSMKKFHMSRKEAIAA